LDGGHPGVVYDDELAGAEEAAGEEDVEGGGFEAVVAVDEGEVEALSVSNKLGEGGFGAGFVEGVEVGEAGFFEETAAGASPLGGLEGVDGGDAGAGGGFRLDGEGAFEEEGGGEAVGEAGFEAAGGAFVDDEIAEGLAALAGEADGPEVAGGVVFAEDAAGGVEGFAGQLETGEERVQ
jgi:hypothetical protein